MRAPLSWLKDFVDIVIPLDTLVDRMTMAGLEVGGVEHIGADWQRDKLFVGEVMEVSAHPHVPTGWCWRRWLTARAIPKRWSSGRRT